MSLPALIVMEAAGRSSWSRILLSLKDLEFSAVASNQKHSKVKVTFLPTTQSPYCFLPYCFLSLLSPSSILYPCDMNYFTIYSDIYHPESQKKSISRPGGFSGNDIDTVFSLRKRSHLPARHIIPHTSDTNRQPAQAPRNFPLNASCIIRRV